MMGGEETSATGRWEARLAVRFGLHDGRTVVREREHRGPLQVQRAFYPEGPELCHLYLLHPPGGLVAGDRLTVSMEVDPAARALVTTPAAGKVYRGDQRPPAVVRQRLRVAAGASLEWFPQETIVFDGGRVELETRVELEQGAAFLGWELVCLGRPAAGETFEEGSCRQRFELWRAGRPLCLERARLDGGASALQAPWGLGAAPVSATLLATPVAESLEAIRALPAEPGHLVSATRLDDVLVCRYLGPSAERARRHFARVWELVRPALLGRPSHSPRIWST
jgi:urease accessory protein